MTPGLQVRTEVEGAWEAPRPGPVGPLARTEPEGERQEWEEPEGERQEREEPEGERQE
jgi:hypothetical protein